MLSSGHTLRAKLSNDFNPRLKISPPSFHFFRIKFQRVELYPSFLYLSRNIVLQIIDEFNRSISYFSLSLLLLLLSYIAHLNDAALLSVNHHFLQTRPKRSSWLLCVSRASLSISLLPSNEWTQSKYESVREQRIKFPKFIIFARQENFNKE